MSSPRTTPPSGTHWTRRGVLATGLGVAAGGAAAGVLASRGASAAGGQPAYMKLQTERLASVPQWFLSLPGTVRQAALPRTNWNGQMVIHPTVLGNWLNGRITQYDKSGDRAALTTAVEGLDEIYARSTKYQGAAFVAYEFSYNGGPNPWFSSFGQSKFPLSAHRLYTITGETRFLRMRDEFMNAFDVPRAVGRPWVASVDGAGGLWLDEYPRDNKISMVFNGQVYALAELLRYWEVTKEDRALQLVRGALWTAWFHRHRVRRPGLHSRYYVNSEAHVASYHYFNTQCYWLLHGMTNHPQFALAVDDMLDDWVCDDVAGQVRIVGGVTHQVRNGTVVKQWRPTSTLSMRSAKRQSMLTSQAWSRMDSGPMAGWFIAETPYAYREGFTTEQWRWLTPRPMRFVPGIVRGYAFSANGNRVERKRFTATAATRALANRRVILGGRTHVEMKDGPLAGLWVEWTQVRPA